MKQKPWYKWVILGACFLLMAVPFSIVNSIHPLFMNPVSTEQGFRISEFSLIFTISAIVVAIASPMIGKLMEKFKLKWLMSVSAFLVGGGFFCYQFAENIYVFYILAILISCGMAGLTMIPISTMLVNWFGQQSGTAMGIAFAGAGTGTFFWMQWVSRWIESYGYQQSYAFLGSIILLVALPVCLGIIESAPLAEKTHKSSNRGGHESAVLKEMRFWLFSFGLFIMGTAVAGTQIHVQSYLASLGYPLSFGANVGSVLAVFALTGSVVGGFLFDKIPTQYALGIFGSFSVLALLLLLFAQNETIPYLFAAIFGLSLCISSIWPAFGVKTLFDRTHYAKILGMAQLFFTAGGAVGPFFSGLVADTVGYHVAWGIYLLFTILYLVLFILLIFKRKQKVLK